MTNESRIDCDVAIVGASLSGSAAAAVLAANSFSVILIDAQDFPRGKACGEGLSSVGVGYLSDLGLPKSEFVHQPLSGYHITRSDGRSTFPIATLEHEEGFGVGVSRACLDERLLQRVAARPEVRTILGTRVNGASQTGDQCFLQLTDGREIRSRFVIDASGGKQVCSARTAQTKAARYGWSAHYDFTSGASIPNRVNIILKNEFELFLTPIGGGQLNISLLAAKEHFSRFCRDGGKREVQTLAEEFLDAPLREASDLLCTGPVGNRRRSETEGRFYFVGDACEQFDPIGGMGMSHALGSGVLAAEALCAALSGSASERSAARQYAAARQRFARPMRGFTRLTYLSLVTLRASKLAKAATSNSLGKNISAAVHRLHAPHHALLSYSLIQLAGL